MAKMDSIESHKWYEMDFSYYIRDCKQNWSLQDL